MNVNVSNSIQQQMQIQTKKMDNIGSDMRDVMQSLPPEDRASVKEQLNAMSQKDKVATLSEMKQTDATSMKSDEYAQAIIEILNQRNNSRIPSSSAFKLSVYA